MSLWVNRVAFGRGGTVVHFRSSPKTDLNSALLTYRSAKMSGCRCSEARGGNFSMSTNRGMSQFVQWNGSTIPASKHAGLSNSRNIVSGENLCANHLIKHQWPRYVKPS